MSNDTKNMGLFAHLGLIFSFLVPLIMYFVYQEKERNEENSYIIENCKNAMNFGITVAIVYVLLVFVPFGGILRVLLYFAQLVMCILGALEAQKGIVYQYPFSFKLIK